MKVDDMSQNQIDFIPKSGNYDYPQTTGISDEHQSVFQDIFIDYGLDFNGVVLCLVIFAYLRINGTSAENKLDIPVNASLDTLTFDEDKNLFIEIFNRYKIICEANSVLGETADILEPYYMAGVKKGDVQEWVKKLLELDWSKNGFDQQDCSLFVKEELIWHHLHSCYSDSLDEVGRTSEINIYKELHHLVPLLNIQPDEKQLCTPILYITYLTNIYEKLDWPENAYDAFVELFLDNVTTVQVEPAFWAIHTIQVVLFGCSNQLILKTDDLSKIHDKLQNKVDDRFAAIFLPEVNNNRFVPDVGPITIGNIVIQRPEKGHRSDNLYYVAFLYNLLNEKGRMLVRLDEMSVLFDKKTEKVLRSKRMSVDLLDTDNLLAFFVSNHLIEAMIQINSSIYMLIDKNRPVTRHGKIFFYYLDDFEPIDNVGDTSNWYTFKNQDLTSSIQEYSCENLPIRHDEGACIVSNQEIRLNDYCLLPKKYIYDFDRITNSGENQVFRHLAHNLSPKLSTVDAVLKHLTRFIESHELMQEPLQPKFYEGQALEPVGEAIDKARSYILQMHKLIKDTRKVITEEIPMEEFSTVNLRNFLEATKKKYANRNFNLEIICQPDIEYTLHETSFAEMIDNFIRNAEMHGFLANRERALCKIAIAAHKHINNLTISISNNGTPLPDDLTIEKFRSSSSKGKNSSGDGLGGAYIYKVIRAHHGSLEIIRYDIDPAAVIDPTLVIDPTMTQAELTKSYFAALEMATTDGQKDALVNSLLLAVQKVYPVNFTITLPHPEVNK
jgi:hypothetical protein